MASSSLEACGLGEQRRASLLAVDLAARRRAGKRRLDRRDGRALVEPVHLGVGVEHGDAAARADAPPTVDLPMPMEPVSPTISISVPSMSATIRARSSSVTSGRTPNHFSKPGTA